MSYNEGQHPARPPVSSRTLNHPSFMPMYMTAGFARHHTDLSDQTVLPIIPAEFFYTDPSMSSGRRIPNIVSELRVFDCFRLNTPPPVMSTRPAPPIQIPDPFRSGPYPIRDLGSRTLKVNTLHHPVQPSQVILELTQEEDQAITNLLKLHHQEPVHSDETRNALQMDFSIVDLNQFLHPEPMGDTSAEDIHRPFCSDVQDPSEASFQSRSQQGRWWSDAELKAANTLVNRFSLMERDKILSQDHNKSAVTRHSDPPLYQHRDDSSLSADIQQGSETFPDHESSLSSYSKAKRRSSASGDVWGVKVLTPSESEWVAVRALLDLENTGGSDIEQ